MIGNPLLHILLWWQNELFCEKNVKQTLTASSTMEAENIACYQASYHYIRLCGCETLSQGWLLWIPLRSRWRYFVIILQLFLSLGTLKTLHNPSIKYLFVRKKVTESHICVVHTLTEHILVDPITKGLSPRVF
jgi:hypothetical protein